MISIGHRRREKRNFPRMRFETELSLRIPGGDSSFSGRGEDLSHTGIRFSSDRQLERGQSIEVTVDTGHNRFAPFYAEVRVLRSEMLDDGRFRMAGEITSMA
jgi:hypothetical protein